MAPGVAPAQVAIFLAVMTAASLLITFVGIIQPFLFSEVMHVPPGDQGRLTGALNMAQYLAVAIFIIPAGSLSDHIGRRPVLILAMVGFVVSLIAMPLVSTVSVAILVRFFLGVASTGHTAGGGAMVIDYPANRSRGRFVALILFVQSVLFAIVAGWLLPHLPGWLIEAGLEPGDAARMSLWSLAILGIAGILLGLAFLKSPPRQSDPLRQSNVAKPLRWKRVAADARQIVALGRDNPAFGLAVLVGLVMRSDVFVMLSFLSVWVVGASKIAGLDDATALKAIGLLQVIHYVITAFAPLFFGWLADRANRTTMLIGSLVFSTAAFASTALVHDVAGVGLMVVVALISIGESALNVTSLAALGELAPPELRGSAIGSSVLMGTLSVVLVSWLAGKLFDGVGFAAPFVFLSLLNLLFALSAIVLLARRKRRTIRLAAIIEPSCIT